MKLKLYMNLRDIAGKDELEMELERPVSLAELLRELSTTYGEKMRKFLLKDTNEIADSLIITMNDEVVRKHESVFITNKDEVSILLPLAGG
jgi:MoaD family protein